jgi:hypothetical protein
MNRFIPAFLVKFASAFLRISLFFASLMICVVIPFSLGSGVGAVIGSIIFLSLLVAVLDSDF